MSDEEFAEFLSTAVGELQVKQDDLTENHGFGTQARFWVDQTQGSLDLLDAQGTVHARAAILPVGSWSPRTNTWKWAWANTSVFQALRDRTTTLRELAETTGRTLFTTELFSADEDMAWELTAVAVRHFNAIGAYRAPGRNAHLFLAITEVRQVGSQGWVL